MLAVMIFVLHIDNIDNQRDIVLVQMVELNV